ncbi:MAG TPA: efflux RND transporter periplasmic adaptor subunit [Smithellaceae bacterium]|nr:efflux RND transporter periplasmic adaptor subunit [Smithellaceae bacterium]
MGKVIKKSVIVMVLVLLAGILIFYLYINKDKNAVPQGFVMGNGRLEATEVDIATKLAGRLTEVLVKEGDFVDKDQIVAKIDASTLQALLKQAEAEVKRAKQARETALSRVEGIRVKRDLALKELERSKTLFAKNIFTQQEHDRNQTVKETYDAEYAAAKSLIVETEGAIESAVAQTERLKTEINDCLLRSPIKGQVLSRLAEPGEILPNGGKALTIIDNTDIYMNVYLSEQYAGVIPLSGDAKVVLDAIPDRQFLARVAYVSEKAQFTPKEVETTEERQKLVFRVKIRFQEFNDPRLKPGMPGVAYIRLNPSAKWTELFK